MKPREATKVQELIDLWKTELPVHGDTYFTILFNIKEKINKRLQDAMNKISKLQKLPQEIKDLDNAIHRLLHNDGNVGDMLYSVLAKKIRTIAMGHAEHELQKVYKLSDKEYANLRLKITSLLTEEAAGPILNEKTDEPAKGSDKWLKGITPNLVGQETGRGKPAFIDHAKLKQEDPWAHRSAGMLCRTCMWYVGKKTNDQEARPLGRCRRNAPTLNGYPAVFLDDWCGAHKLDENKI